MTILLKRGENGVENIRSQLKDRGIFSCNDNIYLPSINDIGCEAGDVIELIDSHEIFYCKAYRNRTVYLSQEVYFLLKNCLIRPSLNEKSQMIYRLLKSGPLETKLIKVFAQISGKEYSKAFSFLLENLYVTAFSRGKILTPNWATFVYSTAEEWEEHANYDFSKVITREEAERRLRGILSNTMTSQEIDRLLRIKHK
jgi:hypothetical protein